jgi:hypothetical protein
MKAAALAALIASNPLVSRTGISQASASLVTISKAFDHVVSFGGSRGEWAVVGAGNLKVWPKIVAPRATASRPSGLQRRRGRASCERVR